LFYIHLLKVNPPTFENNECSLLFGGKLRVTFTLIPEKDTIFLSSICGVLDMKDVLKKYETVLILSGCLMSGCCYINDSDEFVAKVSLNISKLTYPIFYKRVSDFVDCVEYLQNQILLIEKGKFEEQGTVHVSSFKV
jgi:hypothetical protein